MPEFDTLVADALGFFDDLAADNSRDWFAANKARYERAVKDPAEALLAEIVNTNHQHPDHDTEHWPPA